MTPEQFAGIIATTISPFDQVLHSAVKKACLDCFTTHPNSPYLDDNRLNWLLDNKADLLCDPQGSWYIITAELKSHGDFQKFSSPQIAIDWARSTTPEQREAIFNYEATKLLFGK